MVVSLASNATYLVGNLASATVNILDLPVYRWRTQYFGANATNPAIADDTANPAGDNVPNLLKYALGMNPTQVAMQSQTEPVVSTNGYLQLVYTRPDPSPADLTYQVEVSDDLKTWCTNSCATIQQIIFNTDHTATVTWECYDSINAAAKKFMRLQVLRKDNP